MTALKTLLGLVWLCAGLLVISLFTGLLLGACAGAYQVGRGIWGW